MYIRSIASKATEIIGPSLKVLEFLRRCGVEHHINIIPNAVDLSDFLPKNVDSKSVDEIRESLVLNRMMLPCVLLGVLGAKNHWTS